MNKRETFMLTALAFSAGTILGFLLSPIKKGMEIKPNAITTNYYDKKPSEIDAS